MRGFYSMETALAPDQLPNMATSDVCPNRFRLHNKRVRVITTEITAIPQPVFDVLAYSRDLESMGLSRQQAEAIARGMTLMVSHQVESLVTREHFDLQMVQINHRFQQVDQRFDQIDRRFEQVEVRLSGVEKSLSGHTVLLSIITLAVVIPLVQSLVSG